MVKVTKLEHCSEQEIDEFFQDDQQKKELLKEEWAREHGFFMEFGQEKLCFFVIEPVEGSHAWLRRLLIFRSNTKMAVFLLVFDWIAEEAERQGYESLIVSVNDHVRAELLELIQFKKIYETPLNEELPGEWYEKKLQPVSKST